MSFIIHDLKLLYSQTFGGKPDVINGKNNAISQLSGSALTTEHLGKEIWLPIRFVGLDFEKFGASDLLLPYSVISLSSKKVFAKTSMTERQGTVKELYSIDDWEIKVKGFLIDDTNRVWPEKELKLLNKLYGLNEAIKLDNALTNVFLDTSKRVVIHDLVFPEVQGGRKHIRPFSMSLESDSIFVLEFETNV